MKTVVIESPYAMGGKIRRNMAYLRACMADCFKRGEAPYASHGLYTQPGVLRDHIPAERRLGMGAGFIWGEKAAMRAIYTDLGVSLGMVEGQRRAYFLSQPCEVRRLGPGWDKRSRLRRWWDDEVMPSLVALGVASW